MARMPLVKAGKYAAVRGAAKPPSTAASARPALSQALKKAGPAFAGVPRPGHTSGLASARATSSEARQEPRPTGTHIFVPKRGKGLTVGKWFYRELREGGYVREYLRAEKAL